MYCKKCKKITDNMGIFLTLDKNKRPVNATSCYKCGNWKIIKAQIPEKAF